MVRGFWQMRRRTSKPTASGTEQMPTKEALGEPGAQVEAFGLLQRTRPILVECAPSRASPSRFRPQLQVTPQMCTQTVELAAGHQGNQEFPVGSERRFFVTTRLPEEGRADTTFGNRQRARP